jgi:UDP-N-acetylmuramate: L-alanyl-gamma-D-glutamyl-meso-diaminopimelate ligase
MARIHFIGICGTAMATLAAMLKARGDTVSGSDQAVYPPMSDFLAQEGIGVMQGYEADHITSDLELVIIGNAVSRGNPELEEVLDRKIRYQSLPEAIRERFLWTARSHVVAGTHGKTTTAALAGWVLTEGGLDPSVLIGGIAPNFGGSYRLGSGRDFVIEGDEYDSAFFDKTAKFLKYLPDTVVVGNLEYDHADIYEDLDAIRTAFRRLVVLVPRGGRLILGADSPEALKLADHARSDVETFGFADGADWRASEVRPQDGRMVFELTRRGEALGHFTLPLHGLHNVRNALAALAIGHLAGLSPAEMQRGLASFQGVRRRLELRGTADDVTVFDDFAHHPTAIRETLRAVRGSYPDRRLWAVFEPRSATSSRRVFQDEFAAAFIDAPADEVLLAPVFRSAVPEAERLSTAHLVKDLHRAGRSARAFPDVDAILAVLTAETRPGDVVVVMSNGAFEDIHQRLLTGLRARSGGGEAAHAPRAP